MKSSSAEPAVELRWREDADPRRRARILKILREIVATAANPDKSRRRS